MAKDGRALPSLRLTLGWKLFLSHVLAVLPLVAFYWVASFWRLAELDKVNEITGQALRDLRQARLLEKSLQEADSEILQYVCTEDPFWAREAEKDLHDFQRSLARELRAAPGGGSELLARVDRVFQEEYAPAFERQLTSGKSEYADPRDPQAPGTKIALLLRQYVRYQERGIAEGRVAVERTRERTRDLLLAGIVAALVLAVATSLLLSWMLLRPVRHLQRVAAAWKRGESEVRPRGLPRDELGDLGRAFGEAIARIDQQQRILRTFSYTDPLTGLYNRRRLDEILAHLRISDAPVAIAMIDIDRFKEYNDRFGHLAGDEVLRTIGEILHRNLRPESVAARYGGEELCLLLFENLESRDGGSRQVLERLRRLVERHPFAGAPELDGGRLTISAGGTLWRGDESPLEALRRADAALYRAKEAGRNRVEWEEPAGPVPGSQTPA